MKIKQLILLSLIPVLIFSCNNINDDEKETRSDSRIHRNIAVNYYQLGEYEKSIHVLEELLDSGKFENDLNELISIHYDLSCNYALLKEKEKAILHLEKAVEYGFANFNHLGKDSDLDLLRDDNRFKEIIKQLKKEQSLWDNPFINTPFRENISEEEKIAGLSKLWSEIKFNFINFDLVPGINLDSLYLAFIPKVRKCNSTLEYYRVLQNFCTHLKDGHTEVDLPKELSTFIRGRVPVQTRLVEDKVIITKVYDDSLREKGIVPGLVITHVDGIEAMEYADCFIRPYFTSNTEHGLKRTIFEYAYLKGPVGKPVSLTCSDATGKVFNFELPRLKNIAGRWEPVVFKKLENNIGYVNIKSFYSDQIVVLFDSIFDYIMETNALIIDLRDNGGGNGRVGWTILGYFTDKPFKIFNTKSRVYSPIWRAWGRREQIKKEVPELRMADANKFYSKPVVILTRARTGSMAENFCVGFRIMKRGIIIGGPTAGSSGTPLFFSLPGGGRVRVVTTRSFYPDNSEFIGYGVQPDIEIHPLIEDFRTGKDRILDKAVEYLSENKEFRSVEL